MKLFILLVFSLAVPVSHSSNAPLVDWMFPLIFFIIFFLQAFRAQNCANVPIVNAVGTLVNLVI
jgi:hypothetical protein